MALIPKRESRACDPQPRSTDGRRHVDGARKAGRND